MDNRFYYIGLPYTDGRDGRYWFLLDTIGKDLADEADVISYLDGDIADDAERELPDDLNFDPSTWTCRVLTETEADTVHWDSWIG